MAKAKKKVKNNNKSGAKAKTKAKIKSNVKAKVKAKSKSALNTKKIVSNKKMNWSDFVTPLDDRIIVQISQETEKRTPGGLILPDTATDESGNLQGTAVSVGRGHRESSGRIRPMDVKIGDHLIFPQFAGSKIELRGENLILLRESEVLGIVTK